MRSPTLTVLEAARLAKVHRFVYCSSSEVYGNSSSGLLSEDSTICRPVTVYGAAKLTGELYASAYLQTYDLPTVSVRPFNAYGPRAYQTGTRAEVLPRFVGRVLNGKPPVIFGDGDNGRDFTYVTEIAAGLLAAGSSAGLIGQTVIPIVPLYFAGERPVVERNGMLIVRDDERLALLPGEREVMRRVRFRTLGCYPLTGAVISNAVTVVDIIAEIGTARLSERQGRVIDHDSPGSMEKKKQEGYF